MEFLVILAMLVAASLGQPVVKTWTLNELSVAIENHTDESLRPYQVDALNQIMYALFTGKEEEVKAVLLSPTGEKNWTTAQMTKAIEDPDTDPIQPFITRALQLLHNINAQAGDGKKLDSIEVVVVALDISVWRVSDVIDAKDDPDTKPELLPYLKTAEDKIADELKEGHKKKDIRVTLVTPVGLVPVKNGTIPLRLYEKARSL